MHLGAHPDDEDAGMMAYMAHKYGTRMVYWSATRGEAGQNQINAYQGEALGVYRTWESLAVRASGGGESLFGPFIDFGFSKNGADCLSKWGDNDLVREIVRAIRLVQPQVVISRWTGQHSDGHGHHQAVGMAAARAFDDAGDPTRFSELEKQGLAAWQPQKLYCSTGGDWQPGEACSLGEIDPVLEKEGLLRINTGEFDPISDCSYQEQAWKGFNKHQTQAMGFVPCKGDFYYYYRLTKNRTAAVVGESSVYDGLDPFLTGLADYPGNGSPSLRSDLTAIKTLAEKANDRFRAEAPHTAAELLMEGLSLLRELAGRLADTTSGNGAGSAMHRYLQWKSEEFEDVTARCLGLKLESRSDHARVTPGQRFRVSSRLWNPGKAHTTQVSLSLRLPSGWKSESIETNDHLFVHDVVIPETARLSCPYWLLKPHGLYQYRWPESRACGQPFGPNPVAAECKVTFDRHHLTLRSETGFHEGFIGGYRKLPVAVIPPISLHPEVEQAFLRVEPHEQQLELKVLARGNMENRKAEGKLSLLVPDGWTATPENVVLSLEKGDAETVLFTVGVPPDSSPGTFPLKFVIRVDNREYDVLLDPVRMAASGIPSPPQETNCIREEFVTKPSQVRVCMFDIRFARQQTYAYISGIEEDLPQALSHFDLQFHSITDKEMAYIDLGKFDAIVVGPNAYLLRSELRKNAARLIEYVETGGTLIVQYQGYGYEAEEFTPYPFQFSHPHDRVTRENAPVIMLRPGHPIFNMPNAITEADFDGWIRDRGLYFFGRWDKRFESLLACSDPGEAPQKGGLLIAGYGRGVYVYTGYSFFRQLPAGVAGAFRLFANILGLPEARVMERIEFLKKVPLFKEMAREHLQPVARIMFEQFVEQGEYICRQGEEGDELFIIKKGEIDVSRKKDTGDDLVYAAGKGDFVGELAILGDIPRTASLYARKNTQLLVIKGDHFITLLKQYGDISIQMLKLLVTRLYAAGGQE